MKALILAAGLGTRLKPFTDHHPKALAPIGQYTLLELAIKRLLQYGIKDIYVNVHHFADQIVDYLAQNKNFGANITISDETNDVLETGGGLLKVIGDHNLTEPILIINADILTNLDYTKLIKHHLEHHAVATLAVQDRNSSRKLIFDKDGNLVAWVNESLNQYKPATFQPNDTNPLFAFSGIQIVHPSIFNNSKLTGKFSLIDLYLEAMAKGIIKAYNHTGDILLDVGKPEAHEQAQELITDIWQ